jgi:hypothetical protein
MKKNTGLVLIFMVMIVNLAMGQEDFRELYKNKVHSYKKVQNVGLALTGIGGGSFLAGTLMLASLPKSYWDSNSTYTYVNPNQGKYDQQAVEGTIFLSIGIGLLAGGLTMSHIAKRKATFYRKQLDSFSLGVISVPGGQGLSLTYRF